MESRSTRVQGLVFGGLMAAMTVVFSLVPGLSVLMPIPLVLAYVRYGGRIAVMTATAATLFTMAFTGVVSAILAIPAGILPGLVFGMGFRRKWKPLTIGLAAVLTFFLGFALEYAVTRVVMFDGRDPFVAMLETPAVQNQVEMMAGVMEQTAAMIESAAADGAATAAQQQMAQQYRDMADLLRRDAVGLVWTLLPASLFFAGAFSSWFNYMLCRLILPRFGHPLPPSTPFAEFRLPIWVIWAYALISLAVPLLAGGDMTALPWWGKLLLNVFTPLMFILVLAGLAVAYGWMRRRGLAKGLAVLILAVAFLLLGQLGMQLLVLLAMWDTVFDVRGLGHGLWKRTEETRQREG
ncbi:DUF2232 domain-containing protein [Symbiobacterium thermophilum]|uniref:DUF2232 domain-containing protein n=1 Tax=Symbiobacterium thermophilum TaxID=2734 RepID=A0A953I7U1_SYMTR|nr:DUF2232 domain-containing protein [Symbiobacterium thermophilum]MBY6275928.1 hypothetical protein [Symbiobacterium thermophilum]